MKLATKLTILSLLLSITPIAIIGYLAFDQSRRTIELNSRNQLLSINILKEAEFNYWLNGNELVLRLLASRPLVRTNTARLAALEPGTEEYVATRQVLLAQHLNPAVAENGHFLTLSVLRAGDGRVLVSTEAREEGQSQAAEAYFIEGKRGTYVDSVRYFPGESQAVMHISTPIHDAAGQLLAVLASDVDLAEMAEIMHRVNSLSASQDSYLVNRDNYFVTRPRFAGPEVILKQTVATAGIKRCLAGRNGVSFYEDYRDVPVMGAYRWLPDLELCLVTEVDQAELFTPVLALRRTIVATAGGLALVVGLLALAFARTLTRPLQELVKGTEEIGRGNLAYRSQVKSGDELGRLAGAFNQMAGQRQQAEEALRQHRDRLELVVAERTRNLEAANARLQQGIAEIRQAEIALRESEERYRSLFQNNHAVMLLIDPETGAIVDANPAACAYYGYAAEEIKQQKITEINQLTKAQVFAEMEKARREQRRHFFFRHRLAGGEVREVEVYSGPIFFQGKQILYSIVHDITERKQMETALKESEIRYRILFENSPISLWEEDFTAIHDYLNRLKSSGVTDFRAYFESQPQAVRECVALVKIVDVNKTTVEMHQAQDKKELLTSLDQVLTGEAYEVFREELIALAEGCTDFQAETVHQTLQGQKIYMSLRLAVPRHAQADLSRVFVSLTNITQLKEAQEKSQQYAQELARSNAELEQFAYIASHDLQEPLRMVSSYVQLLARRYQGKLDQDADDFIAFAVDGAARMKRLINDLLAYSRVGKRSRPFVLTDCQLVFKQTLANLQLAIQESGASVTHDTLPTVMADEIQLEQLFRNLVGNALKFCDDRPPQIHVGVTRCDGGGLPGSANAYWLFSVADNGIGFEPQFAERIFIIFQRLHDREAYPGTGIGLAICKKIVERHGGRIWAESRPGQGATFYFTIPVGDAYET